MTDTATAEWVPLSEGSNVFVRSDEFVGEPWGEACTTCGWCDRPGECVISRPCPACQAGVRELCRGAGNRFSKFHDERWDLVPPSSAARREPLA